MCSVRPLIAFALFLSTSLAQAQQPLGKKDELPHPQTLAELQSAMKSVLEKEKVPGAGVALVSNGAVVVGGIGTADKAANRVVTCETEFRVGSISKLCGTRVTETRRSCRINLQASLKDVAPEVPVQNRWESTNPVRVVNVLEHTAGFDDMMFREVYNTTESPSIPILQVLQRYTAADCSLASQHADVLRESGYGLAGYLVEKFPASRGPLTFGIRFWRRSASPSAILI